MSGVHNIIQIHKNIMWDCHYFMEHSMIFPYQAEGENIEKYFMQYCQSHKTLLWV